MNHTDRSNAVFPTPDGSWGGGMLFLEIFEKEIINSLKHEVDLEESNILKIL
jgi:hypothetical protein